MSPDFYKSVVPSLFLLLTNLTAQNFVPTGSMNEARFYHTATLLDNGTVLVTGGFNGTSNRNTAEIFDPGTGTWRPTLHSMNLARYAHTAIKLLDGRVLLAGGTPSPAPAEIFDPATENITLTSSMNAVHGVNPGIVFNNGKALVLTGSLWFFGTGISEVYDLSTNLWTVTPGIPVGVSQMALVKLPDGTALAMGGYDGYTPTAYSFVESYDVLTNTARHMAPLQVARLSHTATVLPDGKVLIVAGTDPSYSISSTELYDPAVAPNGASTLSSSLNQRRRAHTATLVPNGDVLVAGGYQARHGGTVDADLASAELRDDVTGNWALVGPMSGPRGEGHTATLLPSGGVLVAGGIPSHSNVAPLNTAEIWGGGCLEVPIDIKPGSYPNTINLGSGGTVPVAILSTATFDATTVNPASVTLAGAAVKLKGQGAVQAATQDINGDGRLDLVAHVVTEVLQLSSSDTEAVLQATTFAGQCVTGRDTVRIVP